MGNTVTMPPAEVLYRLAQKAKDRAKVLDEHLGPNSAAEHLNHVGNSYLLAQTQAEYPEGLPPIERRYLKDSAGNVSWYEVTR